MSDPRAVKMDGGEIVEFLQRQQTGVLAMGRDDDGYGIPLSYAFDPNDTNVYLRLGYLPDSQKREYVEAADYVSFVVYGETDDGWKSVVARGELEEVAHSSLESTVAQAVRGIDIPFVTIFERPADEIDFRVTRLDVDKLNGRKQVSGDH